MFETMHAIYYFVNVFLRSHLSTCDIIKLVATCSPNVYKPSLTCMHTYIRTYIHTYKQTTHINHTHMASTEHIFMHTCLHKACMHTTWFDKHTNIHLTWEASQGWCKTLLSTKSVKPKGSSLLWTTRQITFRNNLQKLMYLIIVVCVNPLACVHYICVHPY